MECDCEGRGWIISADGGAGTATRCSCNPGVAGAGVLLARCGVPEEYAGCSWETWRGEQPAEALAFEADPLERRALYVHGLQGRGKTHLATAVFVRVLTLGLDALGGGRPLWRDTLRLVTTLRGLVGSTEDGRFDGELRRLELAPLLLLDDLQLARTPFDVEITDHLIRTRHARRRPTIVTCNASLAQLVAAVDSGGLGRDPATGSRLRGCNVRLGGSDWRAGDPTA